MIFPTSAMSAANSASLIPRRLVCYLIFSAVLVASRVVSTSELAPQVSSSSLALSKSLGKQVNTPSYFEMLGFPLITCVLLPAFGLPVQVIARVIDNSLPTTSHSFSLLSSQSQIPSPVDTHSFTPSSIHTSTAIPSTQSASPVNSSVLSSSTQNGTTSSSTLANATSSLLKPSSTTASAPTQTTNSPTVADINTIAIRRLPFIVASATGASSISSW